MRVRSIMKTTVTTALALIITTLSNIFLVQVLYAWLRERGLREQSMGRE